MLLKAELPIYNLEALYCYIPLGRERGQMRGQHWEVMAGQTVQNLASRFGRRLLLSECRGTLYV